MRYKMMRTEGKCKMDDSKVEYRLPKGEKRGLYINNVLIASVGEINA